MSQVVMIDGVFMTVDDDSEWASSAQTTEQRATAMRIKRNNFLAQSDWTQVADAKVDQAAWATYRQALRDISQQAGFPIDIDWPTKPE